MIVSLPCGGRGGLELKCLRFCLVFAGRRLGSVEFAGKNVGIR